MTTETELSQEELARLGGRHLCGTHEVEAMSRTVSPPYAAISRHQAGPKRSPGPVRTGHDVTLLRHIRQAISASRFTGEGYRKIWARPRFIAVRRRGVAEHFISTLKKNKLWVHFDHRGVAMKAET
jgi:hypothetical protein